MALPRIFKNKDIAIPLNRFELYLLGIKSDSRRMLEQAKADNDMERYKDILFWAILHDDKHPWWHT